MGMSTGMSAGMSAASGPEMRGSRKITVNRRGSYLSVAALDHVSGVLELVSVPAWQL